MRERSLQRPGRDPVELALDAKTAEPFVFDVDGDVIVYLPRWCAEMPEPALDELVLSLVAQIERERKRHQEVGRQMLMGEFARLMQLTPLPRIES